MIVSIAAKEKKNEYNKRRYWNNREAISEARKKYRRDHPELAPARRRMIARNHQLIKIAAINMYSNGTQCCAQPRCGQCDIDVLTLDHINNDGMAHRASIGHPFGGSGFFRYLMMRDYPPGLQVLCASCNLRKEIKRRGANRKEPNEY